MKIIIVGGVAGGMSCAARARRLDENAEIIILERSSYVSFANCGLPYHIGGIIGDRDELILHTPESLAELLNLDVRIRNEAVSIDRKRKIVKVRNMADGGEYEESYDKLVLSPGAVPLKPPLHGIDNPKIFFLRNIEDMDAIKSVVDSGKVKSAVVVGGGYIGVEIAENLVLRGIEVDLVELLDQILPPFDSEMVFELQKHMELNKVRLHLSSGVSGFKNKDRGLTVEMKNSKSIDADMAIISIGVKPDSRLAADAGIELNSRGGIRVSPEMLTSDPDIFAVGDSVEVLDAVGGIPAQIPLAGPANRQGRVAADNIFGRKTYYKGTLGSAILKVFEMNGACVGASEKTLKKLGIKYEKVYLHPLSHAEYYPGAERMHLKVIFSVGDGKILGAQAIGSEGIDKRIDVLATAMKAGMTVFDLEELELCYAPPFGSAKDPINMAGFIASNIIRGDIKCWYPEDYPSETDGSMIIDLRPREMFMKSRIPGAVNIPLSELRMRISEIPSDKNIFLYCRVGFSSYLAYRIMVQKGFGKNGRILKTLSGGITTFSCFHNLDTASL